MSEEQESKYNNSPRLRKERRRSTPDILICERDEDFFKSLYEFIEHEKQFLQCPPEGADELRYFIYRSVFNKVISRATAYKRLLLTIKTEYDDVIVELKRREAAVRATQRNLTTSTAHSRSLLTCRRRDKQLRDRISQLQEETSRLEDEMKRQKSSAEQRLWIPGLTVSQSQDPEALDQQLRRLQVQKTALLDTKSRCVSLEVQARLDAELRTTELRRDELVHENKRLNVLYKRLRFVWERLSCREDNEQQVPVEELASSALENISPSANDGDAELLEDEEPTGVDESELLKDHVDRFLELFESAQYEEAALVAARSTQGVLRNLDIMEMFKGVTPPPASAPPDSAPPLLVFFQALLVTVPPGVQLSPPLSSQCVLAALRHGALQLVTHAVTQNKLSPSERLGDVLVAHAQENAGVFDQCLTLASVVYEACGQNRKSVLSMCRRGLIHSAGEFMDHCENFTADDIIWVLSRSPSLSLLQLLTEPRLPGSRRRAAILSAGVACSALLAADPPQQQMALQLLDGFVGRGREVLEDAILGDSESSVDVWADIASLCSELKRDDLSRTVLSILLDQSGTSVLTSDLDGARLMEHVFL